LQQLKLGKNMTEKKDNDLDVAPATEPNNEESTEGKAPNIFQVMGSVLAAFSGIQNKKNKERDFKHGNFKVFVAVGILFTLLFLFSVAMLVQLVID
jgi:hypothetical protein